MKAIVGVMPLWDESKNSIWMLPGYMNGIEAAGGIPVILPLTDNKENLEQVINMCGGFLFTGGQDVSPEFYNEKALPCVDSCKKRDIMESYVLKRALDLDKAVLGICRGIQFINAYLGGSLYQDLQDQHPSEIEHHQKAPYDIPVHEVKILQNTPLWEELKVDHLAVNSYHHQAVKNLAPEVQAMAFSPDGLVESLYRPKSKFLWAVQWHPEFNFTSDKNSALIFEKFISEC